MAVPALLRESYRDGLKIKKYTIANLSDWPTELVEELRSLLKAGNAAPADQNVVIVGRALPHGHVAAVLGTEFGLRSELFNEGRIAL